VVFIDRAISERYEVVTFIIGVWVGITITAMCIINKRWNTAKEFLHAMQDTPYSERVGIKTIARWMVITPARALDIIRYLRKKQFPIVFRPGGYYYATYKNCHSSNEYLKRLGAKAKLGGAYCNLLHIITIGETLDINNCKRED